MKPQFDMDLHCVYISPRISPELDMLWICDNRDYYIAFSISALVSVSYRTEGFRPRSDMGRGMKPGSTWKMSCNDLFITYFVVICTILNAWYGRKWTFHIGPGFDNRLSCPRMLLPEAEIGYQPRHRPISALRLRFQTWYGNLGLIPGPIWEMTCYNL